MIGAAKFLMAVAKAILPPPEPPLPPPEPPLLWSELTPRYQNSGGTANQKGIAVGSNGVNAWVFSGGAGALTSDGENFAPASYTPSFSLVNETLVTQAGSYLVFILTGACGRSTDLGVNFTENSGAGAALGAAQNESGTILAVAKVSTNGITKSTNDGVGWTTVGSMPGGNAGTNRGIAAVGDRFYITGRSATFGTGTLYYTDDEGVTLNDVGVYMSSQIDTVCAITDDYIVVAGGGGAAYQYNPGTNDYTTQPAALNCGDPTAQCIRITADGEGNAVAIFANGYASVYNGSIWQPLARYLGMPAGSATVTKASYIGEGRWIAARDNGYAAVSPPL